MSKTIRELPATELVERAIQIARIETTNDESRVWGALHDTYTRDLPYRADWQPLVASAILATSAKYTTGTVTATTGSTSITFSSDVSLSAAYTGWRLRFNDNPNVYTFTYTNATAGTISPALSEDRSITAGAYTLFQPVYPLASNFDRFPKNGGLQLWQGGAPTPIPEVPLQEYYSEFTASPTRPVRCRLIGPDTAGNQQVELGPPPDKAYAVPYDYFYLPEPLRETTAGTVTINAGSSTATFHGTAHLSEAGSGWYFRVDAFGDEADSEWYRVLALSAANSTVTLQTAFGVSGATSANYTLCNAPALPSLFHGALLHGMVKYLLADQNDKNFIYADSMESAIYNDAKRLYKTRTYNQTVDTILTEYHFRR